MILMQYNRFNHRFIWNIFDNHISGFSDVTVANIDNMFVGVFDIVIRFDFVIIAIVYSNRSRIVNFDVNVVIIRIS